MSNENLDVIDNLRCGELIRYADLQVLDCIMVHYVAQEYPQWMMILEIDAPRMIGISMVTISTDEEAFRAVILARPELVVFTQTRKFREAQNAKNNNTAEEPAATDTRRPDAVASGWYPTVPDGAA